MGLLDKLKPSKDDDDDKPKTGAADLAAASGGDEGSLLVDPAYWNEHDPPLHGGPSELDGEAAAGGSGKQVIRGEDRGEDPSVASEYGAPGEEGGPGGEEGGAGQGDLRNPGGTGSPGGVPEGV